MPGASKIGALCCKSGSFGGASIYLATSGNYPEAVSSQISEIARMRALTWQASPTVNLVLRALGFSLDLPVFGSCCCGSSEAMAGVSSASVLAWCKKDSVVDCREGSVSITLYNPVNLLKPKAARAAAGLVLLLRVENALSAWALWQGFGLLRRCRTNLVDPASSHMLVSKIKPCMSQHKFLHGEAANGSLKQL